MTMIWHRFSSIGLKWKFTIVFLLLVTLPATLFGVLVLNQTSSILNQEALQSTDRIMSTIELNITSLTQNVEDISTYSIFSDDIRNLLMKEDHMPLDQLLKSKEQVMGYYTFHLMSKPFIRSIALYDVSGRSLLQIGEPVTGDEKRWTEEGRSASGAILWTDAYGMESRDGQQYMISLFRQINDINNFQKPLGEIRIRLNEDRIYQMISAGVKAEQDSIFIMKRDGTIIAHKDGHLLGKMFPDEHFIAKVGTREGFAGFEYEQDGRAFFTLSKPMKGMDWVLVVLLDKARILKETDQVKRSYTIMLAAMLLLGIVALIGFYYTIIRPILQLIVETRKVGREDFSARVRVMSGDELGVLGNRFNQMVATIEWLIDSKYKLEIKQKESELKALQAQISPHFLYNTLDTIRWTARMEKAMKTSRLIEILSRFLRMGLSGGRMWVTLTDELTYTRSYLELQQERMGSELRYSIFVDASVEQIKVQKQIIQPLVENSIVHGFKDSIGDKWIRIRCYAAENELHIDVIDNGSGFPSNWPDPMSQIMSRGKGYAMKNIHERLHLGFGSEYGLQCVEHNGRGVWLRLRLPLASFHTENGEIA
jgi:two-component system sensor histidine kinase YesM